MLPKTEVRRRGGKRSAGARTPVFALSITFLLLAFAAWAIIGSWRERRASGVPLDERRPVEDLVDRVSSGGPGDGIAPRPGPASGVTGGGPPPAEVVAETHGERVLSRLATARSEKDDHALREALGAALLQGVGDRARREAWRAELDALNARFVFSDTEAPGFVFETVRSGDSYWRIARRIREEHGVSVGQGLLEWINRVPAKRLRPGMRLKVPVEPLELLVDKSEFRLHVLLGGTPIHSWAIGTGKDDRTPEGRFTIAGKTARPTWTDPETGKVHRYGDPGHEIGSHWLGFADDGERTSYGIHGTIDPESVGRAESAGCIRMRDEDVTALFDLVPEGTPVRIRR